jgi:SecD/SecF fusion protein
MVQNLGRKTFLIFLLLIGSALSILLPDQPFVLGLDLSGGSRLVYQIDWERALAEGKINSVEYADKDKLLADTLSILRERVDPYGTLEANFQAQGNDRFVIEIPSTANVTGSDAVSTLVEKINGIQSSLTIAAEDEEMLALFPTTGGRLQIGAERMSYERRQGDLLLEVQRGVDKTTPETHEAGELVELKGEDAIRSLIENPGSMKFYIAAEPDDFPPGTDFTSELQKVRDWRAANPDAPITGYNQQLAAQPGPLGSLRAFVQRVIDKKGETLTDPNNFILLRNPKDEWNFTGDDLKTVHKSQDQLGLPAVGLEMATEKEFAFSDFSGDNKGRSMAIVLNDEIVSLATIKNRLPGAFIIEGGSEGFTQAEVDQMVKVLKSGSLIMKPELENSERVGAKLGDQYIRQGFTSAILGLVLVLVFMMLYYRKLGLFAAISLLSALTMLMGGMAFLKATLTLPGVAGIILTVGMAVDANILIYERIREELARGRKLAQACENGFARAFVTIIDANVTTLITAIILFKVGTGPVRGFATTLMIGIVTAVFAALVITRAMVDSSLARGTERFSMGRLVHDTKIAFMSKAKYFLCVSAVLIVAGVGLFISMPDAKKLGIDFVGGVSVTANLEEPQKTDTVRERISLIGGALGESAEVVALKATGDETNGYRSFRITYKSLVDVSKDDQEAGAESTGEDDIESALEDLLAKGPVVGQLDEAGARGRLYFEDAHAPDDIQAILAGGGFGEVTVEHVEGFVGTYNFTATLSPTTNVNLLKPSISKLFSNQKDSAGRAFILALPIPSSTVVGAQVVGELRDAAILAILISLFAVVMYIRVRFAEYSFGFAAVVALVHDVLITLGALAVCDSLNIIDAEISLPMIAAFLTIIGYSLNDTIVVFDRIRENRPRMADKTLPQILDISINQTLSRTLLTSITTLIAVVILFVYNYGGGSVLEGFAFALALGVLVGTYSSVFVASPALIWFEHLAEKRAASQAKKGHGKAQSGSTA